MSLQVQTVNADFAVAAQLTPAQMGEVAAAGFRSVINNRPDLEGGPEQPDSVAIAEAARGVGLHYAHLPVIPNQFTAEQIADMAALIARMPKPVLAFCRSGGRAAALYQAALEARG